MKKKVKKVILFGLLASILGGCNKEPVKIEKSIVSYKSPEPKVEEQELKQELNILEDNYRTYYEVFIYSFCDSNQDGIGDIQGLIGKLDYIQDMGFNGIWLMPFMAASTYHKYDVKDYLSIDPEYGSLEDFKQLIDECHSRKMKVIMDFPVNHTSAHHPWFKQAADYLCHLPEEKYPSEDACPYISYYNFVEGNPDKSQYHRLGNTDWFYECVFWDQMPDLNLGSPLVKSEIKKIASYWINFGIDGFRLDAVKEYFSGSPQKNKEMLSWFIEFVKEVRQDIYVVGEVWEPFASYSRYYDSGIDSVFNFAFAQENGKIATTLKESGEENTAKAFGLAMIKAQKLFRKYSENAIDAPFLSNHDTARVAGYFGYAATKIKVAAGMCLMMSGSAFVYYGEEIGMINTGKKDENKRAPMYWSNKNTKGITKGPMGMEKNPCTFGSVEEQKKDPLSIINYYKRGIRLRNENPEIARGTIAYMNEVQDKQVCAITKTYKGERIIILYNLSEEKKEIQISKEEYGDFFMRGYLSPSEEKPFIKGSSVLLPPYTIVVIK